MEVRTEVTQELSFTVSEFKQVKARFYNGHIQWLRFYYKEGTHEYEIRFTQTSLKEFKSIIDELMEFSEDSSKSVPDKMEKARARRICIEEFEKKEA